jgi:Ribbon-helix-helix protein, copG family
MATPRVKSTYVMDLETAETLDRLAREWQVSKSEALRRAIRSAAAGDPPDRVTLFRSLQEAAGVTREKADRWVASIRAERAGILRRKSARRRPMRPAGGSRDPGRSSWRGTR